VYRAYPLKLKMKVKMMMVLRKEETKENAILKGTCVAQSREQGMSLS
jgi:hypothetical protein